MLISLMTVISGSVYYSYLCRDWFICPYLVSGIKIFLLLAIDPCSNKHKNKMLPDCYKMLRACFRDVFSLSIFEGNKKIILLPEGVLREVYRSHHMVRWFAGWSVSKLLHQFLQRIAQDECQA